MVGSGPAEAPRRPYLYVGNLSPRVSECMLTEILAVASPVKQVKIIPDVNHRHGGFNYGFVEYFNMRPAEIALQTLNGRKIFDAEIRVEWAYQGSMPKEDTSNHFQNFVSDHSPDKTPAIVDGCRAARVDNNGNNNALQTVRIEIHVVHDDPSALSTTSTAKKFGPRLSLDQFARFTAYPMKSRVDSEHMK